MIVGCTKTGGELELGVFLLSATLVNALPRAQGNALCQTVKPFAIGIAVAEVEPAM